VTTLGQQNWIIPEISSPPVGELAATILRQRGFSEAEFLNVPYARLGDPFLLPDMQAAVDHLIGVKRAGRRVVVYGDYDIDGLTATTMMVEALRKFGLKVESYIPDRFVEGYGLHAAALMELQQSGVDTVVTVDCGISAVGPIAEAAQAGLHMIITDHHTVPDVEPTGAVAMINPLRAGNDYPERSLAGVGVAFALVRALQQADPTWLPVGQEKWLLDLVALGTVCDVVPLLGENRLLAYYGLQVARQSRRPGFRSLAEVSSVDLQRLGAQDFGFKFGPRLNAAGRLEHARTALQLLMSEEITEARELARRLDTLNAERRELTAKIVDEARAQASEYLDDPIFVLSGSEWSHGVAGLVASRLAEEFGRPTIILNEEGEFSKGSARSSGVFRLIDALRAQDGLFEKYGGHAAAAGMTIRTENISRLRKALIASIDDEALEAMALEVKLDMPIAGDYLSTEGLDQLAELEPFGQGHEVPLFYYRGQIDGIRWVGRDETHGQVMFRIDGRQVRAIAFSARQKWPFLEGSDEVELALRLRAGEWQGVVRPDLEVVYAREYRK